MNYRLIAPLFSFSLFAVTAAAQMADRPGYKDPELFNRIPGYYLAHPGSVDEKQFEAYEFRVAEGVAGKKRVEGKFVKYKYSFDPKVTPVPSTLQVIRNYQNAAAKLGGKTLFQDRLGRGTTLLIAKNGNETWVEVYAIGTSCNLTIVEKQGMKQDVVATATEFQNGLAQNGHVEVPGILFDFAKADVKPESEPALQEVAKLLQSNPSLKVWVVGHTDNVGSADVNLKLSSARAAAIMGVLVKKMSVDAGRLAPFGAGPYSPVASNGSEEGRTKNRRVELVAQP